MKLRPNGRPSHLSVSLESLTTELEIRVAKEEHVPVEHH
jgi:hypothetical protein